MKQVVCPSCAGKCTKYGRNKSGTQRWRCTVCSMIITPKIDNTAKQLQMFLRWLFSRQSQRDMPGEGRTFRRKTAKFWSVWPLPPKVETARDVVYVDGIYIGRKACILICCDEKNVLGWYLCRYEHARAYTALLSRIAEPSVVVSDGGSGLTRTLKQVWPNAHHQRCVFHVFNQVKQYTTSRPKLPAGIELFALAKELLHLRTPNEMEMWIHEFLNWMDKYQGFLSQMTQDENGRIRPTHEKLVKARNSLIKLIREGTMFTYLDSALLGKIAAIPSTNNQIEGGVNARLRSMLRDHRGLNIERRIKAVFWWCYVHSPEPLSAAELLRVMPSDRSIVDIYNSLSEQKKVSGFIPTWCDAVVWNELHCSFPFPERWS